MDSSENLENKGLKPKLSLLGFFNCQHVKLIWSKNVKNVKNVDVVRETGENQQKSAISPEILTGMFGVMLGVFKFWNFLGKSEYNIIYCIVGISWNTLENLKISWNILECF